VGRVQPPVAGEGDAHRDVRPDRVDEVPVVRRAVDERPHQAVDVVAHADVLTELEPVAAHLRPEVRVVGDLAVRHHPVRPIAGDRRELARDLQLAQALGRPQAVDAADELGLCAGVGGGGGRRGPLLHVRRLGVRGAGRHAGHDDGGCGEQREPSAGARGDTSEHPSHDRDESVRA
jgi:hypothetical protein